MFTDDEIAREKSKWIRNRVWNGLLACWNSQIYHNKCVMTKNWTSNKGRSTSITHMNMQPVLCTH